MRADSSWENAERWWHHSQHRKAGKQLPEMPTVLMACPLLPQDAWAWGRCSATDKRGQRPAASGGGSSLSPVQLWLRKGGEARAAGSLVWLCGQASALPAPCSIEVQRIPASLSLLRAKGRLPPAGCCPLEGEDDTRRRVWVCTGTRPVSAQEDSGVVSFQHRPGAHLPDATPALHPRILHTRGDPKRLAPKAASHTWNLRR